MILWIIGVKWIKGLQDTAVTIKYLDFKYSEVYEVHEDICIVYVIKYDL